MKVNCLLSTRLSLVVEMIITINKRIVLNLSAIKRKHRYVCFTETYLGCLELFFAWTKWVQDKNSKNFLWTCYLWRLCFCLHLYLSKELVIYIGLLQILIIFNKISSGSVRTKPIGLDKANRSSYTGSSICIYGFSKDPTINPVYFINCYVDTLQIRVVIFILFI